MSNINPLNLYINVAIPAVDDNSVSLYEAVALINAKLGEVIQKINTIDPPADPYSPDNPPPYPVTSVNTLTGNVILTADNINYDDDVSVRQKIESLPDSVPVKTVNFATGDIVTVFVPDGGVSSATQSELIAACDAGAMFGCDLYDDKTFHLYLLSRLYSPDRVEIFDLFYSEAGVNSVNGMSGIVTLTADNVNYDSDTSIKDKIDSLPSYELVEIYNNNPSVTSIIGQNTASLTRGQSFMSNSYIQYINLSYTSSLPLFSGTLPAGNTITVPFMNVTSPTSFGTRPLLYASVVSNTSNLRFLISYVFGSDDLSLTITNISSESTSFNGYNWSLQLLCISSQTGMIYRSALLD